MAEEKRVLVRFEGEGDPVCVEEKDINIPKGSLYSNKDVVSVKWKGYRWCFESVNKRNPELYSNWGRNNVGYIQCFATRR